MDIELVGGAVALTAFGWGFRHGFDVDHLAAIGDLTQTAPTRRRGLLTSTAYIAGHAAAVVTLSVLWITFGQRLPLGIDTWMGRLVGVTILVLGVVVLVDLARTGGFRPVSRVRMITEGLRWLSTRLGVRRTPMTEIVHAHPHDHAGPHDHTHDPGRAVLADPQAAHATHPRATALTTSHSHAHVHRLPVPDDPLAGPGALSAGVVGIVHGVGAETPTQLLVLATAAGASTPSAALGYVAAFVAGIATANTVVAGSFTLGVLDRGHFPRANRILGVLVGSTTVAVGLAMTLDVAFPGLA